VRSGAITATQVRALHAARPHLKGLLLPICSSLWAAQPEDLKFEQLTLLDVTHSQNLLVQQLPHPAQCPRLEHLTVRGYVHEVPRYENLLRLEFVNPPHFVDGVQHIESVERLGPYISLAQS
jgi:hypothetical protein